LKDGQKEQLGQLLPLAIGLGTEVDEYAALHLMHPKPPNLEAVRNLLALVRTFFT